MCGHMAVSLVLIFHPFNLFEVYHFILNFSSILNFCIISSLHSWITICANCHSDLPPCVLHVENNRSDLLGDHVGLAM